MTAGDRYSDTDKERSDDNKKTGLLPALKPALETAALPSVEYRAGKRCPRCKHGILDYDGLLNLVCPVCGPVQGGCFT